MRPCQRGRVPFPRKYPLARLPSPVCLLQEGPRGGTQVGLAHRSGSPPDRGGGRGGACPVHPQNPNSSRPIQQLPAQAVFNLISSDLNRPIPYRSVRTSLTFHPIPFCPAQPNPSYLILSSPVPSLPILSFGRTSPPRCKGVGLTCTSTGTCIRSLSIPSMGRGRTSLPGLVRWSRQLIKRGRSRRLSDANCHSALHSTPALRASEIPLPTPILNSPLPHPNTHTHTQTH